jgi:GLPGLI family protein
MKKIITLSIFIFMLLNLKAQNNSGTITYKKIQISKTFTEDKRERLGNEKFNQFSKLEESMNNAYKDLSFILEFNRTESVFKVQKFLETPKHRFLKFAVGSEGKGVYYNSKEERIRKMNSFGEDFLIYYDTPPINWKLENKTKKIGNYICYKATTIETYKTAKGTKQYIINAWYTPEINAQYGPIGFSGLPGLILELDRDKFRYYVDNITINTKKEIKIIKPKSGKKITKEEYNDLAINAMSNYQKIRG